MSDDQACTILSNLCASRSITFKHMGCHCVMIFEAKAAQQCAVCVELSWSSDTLTSSAFASPVSMRPEPYSLSICFSFLSSFMKKLRYFQVTSTARLQPVQIAQALAGRHLKCQDRSNQIGTEHFLTSICYHILAAISLPPPLYVQVPVAPSPPPPNPLTRPTKTSWWLPGLL